MATTNLYVAIRPVLLGLFLHPQDLGRIAMVSGFFGFKQESGAHQLGDLGTEQLSLVDAALLHQHRYYSGTETERTLLSVSTKYVWRSLIGLTNPHWGIQLSGGCLDVLSGASFRTRTRFVTPWWVRRIGLNTFNGLTTLVTVVLSIQLSEIGSYAFAKCTSLTTADFSKCARPARSAFTYGRPHTKSKIKIGLGAFQGCLRLRYCRLPQHLGVIGTLAFAGCHGLVDMDIPPSVHAIGEAAFKDCGNLNNVVMSDELASRTICLKDVFQTCGSLTGITIRSTGWFPLNIPN